MDRSVPILVILVIGYHTVLINFQVFAARLTAGGIRDLSPLGVYRLRDVLKEDPDHYIPKLDPISTRVFFLERYGFLFVPKSFCTSVERMERALTCLAGNIGRVLYREVKVLEGEIV